MRRLRVVTGAGCCGCHRKFMKELIAVRSKAGLVRGGFRRRSEGASPTFVPHFHAPPISPQGVLGSHLRRPIYSFSRSAECGDHGCAVEYTHRSIIVPEHVLRLLVRFLEHVLRRVHSRGVRLLRYGSFNETLGGLPRVHTHLLNT